MDPDRLEQQIAFVREADKLKTIDRQTLLTDASRRENDAEHSWHLALMALVLGEYAGGSTLDLLHVIRMVLIHDLVGIDAGDTYCYDQAGYEDKSQRETAAAQRIFNLLPPDQAA
jgi:putative hydrolase of HD superfamily